MLLFLCLIKAEFTRQQNLLPKGKTLATDASDPANDCNLCRVICVVIGKTKKLKVI